ncbi:PREDICTED: uncharacterized protein LOC105153281 [Acromyrmex echinatior]|nr:PREDICTED: uncharacterized protein LOC105153281 [Acromyrmex echinatior]
MSNSVGLVELSQLHIGSDTRVITGDESWVYGYDVETKAQSSQWKLPHEPRSKKARQVRSNVKVLLTVFFDYKGVVHHEFLPQSRTVNKEYYLQVMRNLRKAIRQKRPDLWKNKNWLLHNNAPAHTSLLVREFLAKNNTLMMPQPPYSPDLAPCDFFLFPKLKRPMKGRCYATIEEIKTASKEELNKITKNDFLKCFEDWKKLFEQISYFIVKFQNDITKPYPILARVPQDNVLGPSHVIKMKKSKRKKDKESGVARGIDFQFVSNVINFDFPLNLNSYVHRAGRTARGKNQGTVLSFVAVKEKSLMEEVELELKHTYNCENLFKIYQFKLEEMEGFRYRAKDAWKAVTRIAVREARLKEIKQEVINCEKLKSYFEDNPRDLKSLRQDKTLHTVKLQPHLKDVPEYIVPPTLKKVIGIGRRKRKFDRDSMSGATTAKSRYLARASNPLISLQIPGNKSL